MKRKRKRLGFKIEKIDSLIRFFLSKMGRTVYFKVVPEGFQIPKEKDFEYSDTFEEAKCYGKCWYGPDDREKMLSRKEVLEYLNEFSENDEDEHTFSGLAEILSHMERNDFVIIYTS